MIFITGEQIRAARAISRIEQAELAKRTGLSLETIKRLERIRGPVAANIRTVGALFDAFTALGVRIGLDRDGAAFVSIGGADSYGPTGLGPLTAA